MVVAALAVTWAYVRPVLVDCLFFGGFRGGQVLSLYRYCIVVGSMGGVAGVGRKPGFSIGCVWLELLIGWVLVGWVLFAGGTSFPWVFWWVCCSVSGGASAS